MSTLEENLKSIQQEKNTKIIPENIRAGVKIFNIVGALIEEDKDKYNQYLNITKRILGEKVEEKSYTELEYIEATGTQYIDTEYIPNSDTAIEMSVSNVTPADAPMISSSSKWQLGSFILTSSQGSYKWYYNGEIKIGSITEGIDKLYLYRGKTRINDVVKTTDTSINSSLVSDTSLRIFNGEIGGSMGSYTSYRLHSFKILTVNQDGETVCIKDFIPAIQNSTGEIGLYEKNENKFYENKGTGFFLTKKIKEYVSDGLVSRYILDSDVKDSIGENNATNYGLTFVGDEDLKQSVAVSGEGYATFINSMDKTNVSLSILAKSSGNTDTYNFLFAFGDLNNSAVKDNALSLTVAEGKLSLDVSFTTFNTDFDVNDGLWHRYTVTLSENQYIKIYVDEELIYETTHKLSVGNNGFIATWNPELEFFFNGRIAEALIYNRALTADEIKYNCQIDGLVEV